MDTVRHLMVKLYNWVNYIFSLFSNRTNQSSNIIVRESNNEEMKSVVVVIQHENPQENTTYHCQLQWSTLIVLITRKYQLRRFIHEPLKLPGRKTRSKNFKTPFFSRYSKFLPWGSWYRSKTSPKNFFWKNLNKYGR